MSEAKTELGRKMLERADKDGLDESHHLRRLALDFEEKCDGYYAIPQTVAVKQFMGSWARARRSWCDYSGEALI